MSQLAIFTGKSRTLQAANTVTAATAAAPIAITTSAAHGLATGDVIVMTGVAGNVAANGLWTVTVVDTTHYTLNGSVGTVAYTSGGSAAHIGFAVDTLVDNTVLTSNQDFTLKFRIDSLSNNTGVRFGVSDSPDSKATFRQGPTFNRFGGIAVSSQLVNSWKREDWAGCTIGNAGNNFRTQVTLEGAFGALPTAGNSVQVSAWLEY